MRTLLFILLPFLASGQIYVDSYRFGGGAANLLLDDYPGAAAAYSLRLLDKDYTGDCITVRRSSDNALDTFGFVNNYLDTTSLKTFCGTGATDTCWVRIWFDQSGNNRNMLSPATESLQPLLTINGNFQYANNFPSVFFPGSNRGLSNGSLASAVMADADHSIFIALKTNYAAGGGNSQIVSSNGPNSGIDFYTINPRSYTNRHINTAIDIELTSTTIGYLVVCINAPQDAYVNNIQKTASASIVNATGVTTTALGTRGDFAGNTSWNGYGNEYIFYGSNQSSNRTGIESNINSFYSIY